ncbi:endo-beta-N-acetylglucosaminidase [Lentibacillus sp.]|uniref:endo-beta-N-acetylglucosaminidase n=1 Tax=Lentibacillus sp. TaxID=1925746 RepID=UPI002B4B46DE|nr:hypothetical protein [Lentibacillus sp.]HLS09604.1 hypothetical protein [Lentibacillus sp.]
MRKRNNRIGIFFSVILAVALPFTFTSVQKVSAADEDNTSDVINEKYSEELSLQPVAPAFSVESLLNWSPETSPDSQLNQASVTLNENRFKGHQVNKLANPKAGITSAAITLSNHDRSSSVGSNEFSVYAFDNWQLLDSYIYWPGSASGEGVFSLPSPDIVNAAHRNGVPVYATIGFPWGPGSPEELAEIEAFTQQAEDGSFPVADKMIEAAEYYGFDGYFLNQETYGVSEETAKKMNEMMRYTKRHSDIRFNWYDAQANDGSINYQNAINSQNDMYVKPAEDGTYAADEFFLNYNWGRSEIDQTVSTMNKYQRSPFDAYAGFEVQQNSYNTEINTDALLNEKNQSKVSIALYTPNSTMGLADNPADFHEKEQYFWTGPQGDPSEADDSADWKGMARFVTDSSVIQQKPFTTNFNSGHGKKYFVEGNVASSQEWNNRSIQDIMPTWRWWIRGEGSELNASYDFTKAYNGGNSLKFSGDLGKDSVNDTMLYSTKLDINESTKVRVVYQSEPGADVSLGVSYSEDYSKDQMKHYSLPDSNNGWETAVIDLSEDAGNTAYALSLKISNSAKIDNYAFNLGQLSLYDNKAQKISKPENAEVTEKILQTAAQAEARMSWSAQEDAIYYEVYQENASGDRNLLGATPNNHFYTPNITRSKDNAKADNSTTLQIVPINKNYKRGEQATIDFEWGMPIDATEMEENAPSPNVARNATVTDVSYENDAEPASSALDGTVNGNSKWAATNKESGYMTIDIGEPKTIRRWRIEHAEAGGESKDMNTNDFELLYKNENEEWISANRITENDKAVTDVILDKPITASEFKLQVHDDGSSPWTAIRIYEWQMFESDTLPKTENIMMHFVTAENNRGAQDKVTLENVKKEQTVRLYDSLKSENPLAEKQATKDGTLTFEGLDFGVKSDRTYYTVQSPDLEESLKFSTAYMHEKVTEVYKQIDNLPAIDELTVNDKHIVKDAKVSYNKLHPSLRKEVPNYDVLKEAQERIKDLKKKYNKGEE